MNQIYILWLREIKKYARSKSRVIGTLGMPLLFLFVLGFGLNSSLNVRGSDYLDFILPGVIAMAVLMNSMFSGISVIWDKQFGFMKEMLVAPVSRTTIMVGKTLGGATTAIFQGLIIFIIALLAGIKLPSISGIMVALFFMALIGIAFTSLGVSFASRMEDMQAFPLIMNFVVMPLFFLSGALFPIDQVPKALKIITLVNPMTYGVDALRFGFIGTSHFPLILDFAVLFGFGALAILIGSYLFGKMGI